MERDGCQQNHANVPARRSAMVYKKTTSAFEQPAGLKRIHRCPSPARQASNISRKEELTGGLDELTRGEGESTTGVAVEGVEETEGASEVMLLRRVTSV
jgi:hypothetical protein